MTPVEFVAIVTTFISAHNIDDVKVRFDETGLPERAMAALVCTDNECVIQVDPCVLKLPKRVSRNLAAHEAAHYVNATLNGLYDHGREWANLMREQGWKPIKEYRTGVSRCNA